MTSFDPISGPSPTGPADPARLGRRRFLVGVGAVAGASAVGTLGSPSTAFAELPAGASNFSILTQAYRAADTRSPDDYDYTRVSDRQIRVAIAGVPHPASTTENPIDGVPGDATAVVLTVTAVNFGAPNNVRAYPAGLALPLVSNLNLLPGATNANMVTVKLGAGGAVDVTARVPCHLIVDVIGFYAPVGGLVRQGRYVSLDTPERAFDSKPYQVLANQHTVVDVTDQVPAHAAAVVVNLTADQTASRGFFSALPWDATGTPSTSNLNVSGSGETRAGAAVVPIETIDGKREIKIFAKTAARIIVDVFGFFTDDSAVGDNEPSTDGLFVPLEPVRIMDTRDPGEIGKMWPRWVLEVPLPDEIESKAAAVVVNLTSTQTRGKGHARCSAAQRSIPATSNLNWPGENSTVPNHAVTTVTNNYGLQVFNLSGGHIIVDLAGYYIGEPQVPNVSKYQNPAPPTVGPPWTMRILAPWPRGLTSTVYGGNPSIVDWGHSWHWTGTGHMGQEAHVAVFGHRTSAGGPYRYVDQLRTGDILTITTSDSREYTYRWVRRDLVRGYSSAGPPVADILANTQNHPGTTLSLIACTDGWDESQAWSWLPTSLWHRLIVTFELVSWREL